MLRMDKIQRVVPTYANKFILPTHALGILRRGEKAFTHHWKTYPRFTVNLVAHHGLQRVGMGSGQRATRGENRLTIGVDENWSPVGGG